MADVEQSVSDSSIGFREVEWVADQLGLDKNTVYRYLNDGRLPGLQLGKKWLVEEHGLRAFLRREQRVQTERRQAASLSTALPDSAPWDGTVTILFSDIIGASAMLAQLGDDGWVALIREHNRILRETLPVDGRSDVKALGDGFMVGFRSATEAVRFAAAFMRAIDARNRARPDQAMKVHLGLHAGEVKYEAGEFVGKTVFVAALLAAQAKAGEALASAVVKDLAEADELSFDPGREVELRVGGRRAAFPLLWQEGES
jgi:excisionase family DNA binding protein